MRAVRGAAPAHGEARAAWTRFPATALLVPVGGLNGDRCADAYARLGGGRGGCSALAGVGDLSGDGRADLPARDSAGKLWRYASTGAGPYGARVLVGAGGWNGFKGLFRAGLPADGGGARGCAPPGPSLFAPAPYGRRKSAVHRKPLPKCGESSGSSRIRRTSSGSRSAKRVRRSSSV